MFNQILSIIETNNGLIPSSELATLIGREHANVTKKINAQLTPEQLVKITTCEIEYSKANNSTGTRTVYMLPEAEAMAIAMSYSVQLGMQVYEAYQEYKKALEEVIEAETLEDAKKAAIAALYTKQQEHIFTLMREDKRIGKAIGKLFRQHQDPVDAWDEFYECYLKIGAVVKNAPEYRRGVLTDLRKNLRGENSGYRVVWMKQRIEDGDFSIDHYNKFKAIEAEVLVLESRLREKDKNENAKRATNNADIARKIGKIAKEKEAKLQQATCTIAKINQTNGLPF